MTDVAKNLFISGELFVGRRHSNTTYRYNDETRTVEKRVYRDGSYQWEYYCLANKINLVGFTGTISFLGSQNVTRTFEFKDLKFTGDV